MIIPVGKPDADGNYPELVFTPAWRAQRNAVAARHAHAQEAATSLTAREFWALAWPELYGEVELDLAQTGLVPDLDAALRTHSVHFVASAVQRAARVDGTWIGKQVRDELRRRRAAVQDPDSGGG